MTKRNGIIVFAVAIIALCFAVADFIIAIVPAKQPQADVQYVMYLGTNDKDTNLPVFEPDEAKNKAEEILVKHFGGYTIQEAEGGWENDGIRYREYTIVIFLSDTTISSVHAAADELIKLFNQSSVLIQSNTTVTEFYAG